MVKLLIVGTGGFVGAIARYLLSSMVQRYFTNYQHLGTIAVNILGCFLLGMFMYLVQNKAMFGGNVKLLISIGLIGALTTYSTFAFETYELITDQRIYAAAFNILIHLLIGLTAVWAAILFGKAVLN